MNNLVTLIFKLLVLQLSWLFSDLRVWYLLLLNVVLLLVKHSWLMLVVSLVDKGEFLLYTKIDNVVSQVFLFFFT